MDEDISRWVLEFLLRQSTAHLLINKILANLPVANNNSRLKKTVLLRAIQTEISDGLVSEMILDSIESIEDLDKKEGTRIMNSMKAAYCAVAVECTVKYLGGSADKHGKYFDAVKRIWRGKIEGLERSRNRELVTDELMKWRDDIEGALWDVDVCKKIMKKNTRNDALRLVRVYLGEAWAIMGPTFLELAARLMKQSKEKGKTGDPVRGRVRERAVSSPNAEQELGVGDGLELAAQTVNLVEEQGSGKGSGDNAAEEALSSPNATPNLGISDRPARKDKEIQKENVLPKRKHIVSHRRPRGPVKITDSEELGTGTSCKFDSLPTPDVSKVQEALKSSFLELQAVVTDPLPDALRLAETVLSEMARKNINHEPSVEDQNEKDVGVPNPSVNMSVDTVQAKEGNHGNQSCIHQSNVPRPSLMERNGTARCYEWDDSIDGSPEGTSNRVNRPHLPSPKRKVVSPLKKYEITKFARRRKMKRWSLQEEEALRLGVQMYGKGNWKLILKSNPDAFAERTEVDLKDKWRNMTRY